MGITKVVAVKFKGYKMKSGVGQDYHYLSDLDLKVGDSVVVGTPTEGYVVVLVSSVDGLTSSNKATKWIVQKVDDEQYNRREEERRRRAVIETKLKAIERQVEVETKYDYLAKVSPEAADLLRQLREMK